MDDVPDVVDGDPARRDRLGDVPVHLQRAVVGAGVRGILALYGGAVDVDGILTALEYLEPIGDTHVATDADAVQLRPESASSRRSVGEQDPGRAVLEAHEGGEVVAPVGAARVLEGRRVGDLTPGHVPDQVDGVADIVPDGRARRLGSAE